MPCEANAWRTNPAVHRIEVDAMDKELEELKAEFDADLATMSKPELIAELEKAGCVFDKTSPKPWPLVLQHKAIFVGGGMLTGYSLGGLFDGKFEWLHMGLAVCCFITYWSAYRDIYPTPDPQAQPTETSAKAECPGVIQRMIRAVCRVFRR